MSNIISRYEPYVSEKKLKEIRKRNPRVYGRNLKVHYDYAKASLREKLHRYQCKQVDQTKRFGISSKRYGNLFEPICEEVQDIIDEETRSRRVTPEEPPIVAKDEITKMFRDADSFEILDKFVEIARTLTEEELKDNNKPIKPPHVEPKYGGRGCKICGTALKKKTRQWPKFCPWCSEDERLCEESSSKRKTS